MSFEIGFLGYGQLARAVSDGLARGNHIPYSRQMISGRNRDRLAEISGQTGLGLAADNRELTRMCPVVVLGVNPDQMRAVLEEIADETPGKTVISMAAGVTLADLDEALPASAGVVRTMPNLPVLVASGVTLACAPPASDPVHLTRAMAIFRSVGLCLELAEGLFDAGTAAGGSTPAYFFSIMESLVRGAVRLGLPFDQARAMIVQTALGTAQIAAQWPGEHLALLRDRASGPAGTTVEGLCVLEEAGLGGALQRALEASRDRSRQMSEKSSAKQQ